MLRSLHLCVLVQIPNDRLLEVAAEGTALQAAFALADSVLGQVGGEGGCL